MSASSIATHHLDLRMRFQPGPNGRRFAIRKQIYRTVALQIPQHGAIAVAFFQRKVIYAQDMGRGEDRRRGVRQQAQQGREAGGHGLLLDQTCPWSATEGKRNLAECISAGRSKNSVASVASMGFVFNGGSPGE